MKLMFRQLELVVLMLVLSAVPSINFAQQAIDREIPSDVSVLTNLLFAEYDNLDLYLDLYLPNQVGSTVPVVILVQGGGWKDGRKEVFGPLAAALAQRGLAAVSIDYRGIEEAIFPATVQDIKASVRWLRANASKYNINPSRIGILGGSYGAQMGVLSALTSEIKEFEGSGGNSIRSSRVNAVAGFSSPTDLSTLPSRVMGLMESLLGVSFADNPDLWHFASSINHVSAESPPLLLVASDMDKTVPLEQSLLLKEAYENVGAISELHILPKAHHAFWNYEEWFENAMDIAAKFFHTYMRND